EAVRGAALALPRLRKENGAGRYAVRAALPAPEGGSADRVAVRVLSEACRNGAARPLPLPVRVVRIRVPDGTPPGARSGCAGGCAPGPAGGAEGGRTRDRGVSRCRRSSPR